MMLKKPYHDLLVWQEAHRLVLEIYKATKNFPAEERFGVISQLRRAAVSVAANIVEGQSKKSRKDFIRFLDIGKGSLTEVEYFLELSRGLAYLDETEYAQLEALRGRTGFLLSKLLSKLRSS